ncbi:APC family permease [Vitreoscilla massiliensis]|uniref:APC family permease n=1 Tax=Vitreoscilla massiliensis TaxID=1689272 RepID=A0ABY4DZ44_9NEIS|nr:APC family permease [Vitreoscilla massiliensis]UOO88795.1 APC family permease [Vitreoscilla massiliensis]
MSNSLKKSLSFTSLVTLGTAGVIGSGWIYTTSSFFTEYTAGGVVLGMVLACLLAGCVAVAYAELAAQFPRAGGEILFTFIAYNRKLAFVIGWLLIGAFISSTAFYMAAFGGLLSKGFPALKPALESVTLYSIAGSDVYLWGLVAGVVLVLVFYLLNSKSVDVGAGTQKILFGIKVLLGVALALAGIGLGSWDNFTPAFTAVGATETDVMHGVTSTMRFVIPALTFLTGFSLVSLLAEEARISPKKIGVAIVLTIFLAGAYYCLVLLGTAMIIPWQDSAQMEFGAVSTFTHAGYPALGYAAMGIAFLGMGTGSLGMAMGCSRIIFAMGRGGLLPAFLGKVNQNGVPANALTMTLIITLALGWLGKGAMIWFLDTGGVYVGLSWALTVMCMYKIRQKYPNNSRPYQVSVKCLPFVGALGAVGIILMTLIPGTSMSLKPAEYVILLLWVVLGAVMYAIQTKNNHLSDDEALQNMLGDSYDEIKKLK